ncbi:MAG: FISUMP domain-containing protein [Syntrophothermus sp.]
MKFTTGGAILLFFFMLNTAPAQTTISAGNDTIICLGGAASLSAVVTGGGYGTDSYTFEIFPYSPEAYTGGTGVVFGDPSNPNNSQDDKVAGPFDIGFPFCFFNQTYTQFCVGSNGWVGFTYNTAWTTFTSQTIPNTNANCPKNCIMAPWEDWWPNFQSLNQPGVYYYLTGIAPDRKLVVYWLDAAQYGCRNNPAAPKGRFQIVLNEQSSIVENHLTLKPLCGGQTATQGVHNATGTIAFTATGRNSTLWSVSNESTRFVPSGVKWYTGGYPGGTIVGYGATLNISPTVTTTYTAVVQVCGGDFATDDIVVTVKDPDFTYPSYSYCKDATNPVAVITQPGAGTFTSTPAGLAMDPVSGVIDIAASATGTYSITNTITVPCTVSKTRILSIWPLPVPALSGPSSACPDPEEYTFNTDAGMNNYLWTFSPDGTVTQGGTTGSSFIKLKWNTTGDKTITVNYNDSHTCTAATQTSATVTVHAVDVPVISGNSVVCQEDIVTYSTQMGMINYIWTISPAGFILSGGESTDHSVTVKWNIPGNWIVSVNFTNINNCHAVDPTVMNVEVKPLPYQTAMNQTICSGSTTSLVLSSVVPGSTYNWICIPQTTGIEGYSPGSGPQITQTLINSNFLPKWLIYQITASFAGCTGPAINDTVFIKPTPAVSFTTCTDTITAADAKPIVLKGGIPLGGSYTGTGVSGGVFNPVLSGAGTFPVTYTFTNSLNCSDFRTINYTVLPLIPFTCGSVYTDPRNNVSYATVQIGSQCWFADNLNYGTVITASGSMRDNCVFEKYCYNNNPANCGISGGLYQWEEMMNYSTTAGGQGICPPSWHVPDENEWTLLFSNYINNGFSGSALKYTGYSGFDALLNGAGHGSRQFNYAAFATFQWSSSSYGLQKAWAHGMNDPDPSVSLYPSNRNHAFHVRCLKD